MGLDRGAFQYDDFNAELDSLLDSAIVWTDTRYKGPYNAITRHIVNKVLNLLREEIKAIFGRHLMEAKANGNRKETIRPL